MNPHRCFDTDLHEYGTDHTILLMKQIDEKQNDQDS